MQEYKTIREYAFDEFIEKRSRFIGYIKPAATEHQALEFINEIKARHWDATHNVYAYVLREGQIKRYSDDGEPQGTAGMPVLDVLQKEGIVDAAIVVTRYFGGIMLGAGGLVRAYSAAAKIAVDAAEVMTMSPCTVLKLEFDYSLYGKISYIFPRYCIVTLSSDFGAAVMLTILIKDDFLASFNKELTELTANTVVPYEVEKRFEFIKTD